MESRTSLVAAAPRPPLDADPRRRRASWPVIEAAMTTWLAGLAVGLAAVLPYLSTLRAYFSGDDFGLVWNFSNKPPFHALTLFTRPWTEAIYGITADELRPTLALSYQLDSVWGAGWPPGYHASNIGLHALNCLLVFGIARVVARVGLPAATFAGVLYAVLPVHAEPVGWISGRADSIPALFYLACFLAYAGWRRSGRRWLYLAALAAELLALYSKQSAIMMLPTLLLYDALVERRPIRTTWTWLRPYLAFAGLVFGYLGLRYALFGNAVREQNVSLPVLVAFAERQANYVKMLLLGSSLYGGTGMPPGLALLGKLLTWAAILAALLFALRELWRVQTAGRNPLAPFPAREGGQGVRSSGPLLFFGPLWWLLLVLPLVVTYESARHLYLPSAGVAVALGIAFDRLWSGENRARRLAVAAVAAILVAASSFILQRQVEQWNASASVSQKITRDLEDELRRAPPGSLILVGAPVVGPNPNLHTWIWMWSMPFATRPPFMEAGLAERANLVAPPDVHCCPREHWFAATKAALATWAARPERPPIIALRWAGWEGTLQRRTDADDPELREPVEAMLAAPDHVELCGLFDHILGTIGRTCDAP